MTATDSSDPKPTNRRSLMLWALTGALLIAAVTGARVWTLRSREAAHVMELESFVAAHRERHDGPAALEAINELLKLRPNASRWWYEQAVEYDRADQQTAATTAYRRALQLGLPSENAEDARLRLVELFILMGDAEAARSELEKSGPIVRQTARRNVQLARLLRMEGKSKEALPMLETALAELGPMPQAIGLRGMLHLDLGQYGQAAADLEFLAQAQPNDEVAHFKLAEAYRHLGQLDRARQHREQYVRLHEQNFGSDASSQPHAAVSAQAQ